MAGIRLMSRGRAGSAEAISQRCDRVVVAGVVCLVGLTPLAFGSVHPWAFSLIEATVFLLVAVWMAKLLLQCGYGAQPFISGPLAVFLAVVLFQLIPLPPSVLRVLSPSTYELYVRSLPGWPERVGIEDVSPRTRADARKPARALLPTIEEVKRGAAVPFESKAGADGVAGRNVSESGLKRTAGWRWRRPAPPMRRAARRRHRDI